MFNMTAIYQKEYSWGWINKDTLASYVQMGILSKDGYKAILGVDYETAAN